MSDFSEYSPKRGITLAVDVMGGDYGVESAVPGLALVRKIFPDVRYLLFGDEALIAPFLLKYAHLASHCEVTHTDKMVGNADKPSLALRASKGTSMRLAIEAVKEGRADAVISSGNTGALMAMAKMVLRPISGIHRPALASVFPSLSGSETIMLDLGANVLVDADNLVQFAILGSIFARARKGIENPSVGLLNVGSEEMKGPDHVRAASDILSEIDIPGQYIGFVEGNDITAGTVDVVVSDGYVGNISLKAIEGVGKFSAQTFKQAMTAGPFSLIGALFAFRSLGRVKQKLDPRMYNGGVFLGLNGICVKSHGGSDALGFSTAVKLAIQLAQHNYVQSVIDDLDRLMDQGVVLV